MATNAIIVPQASTELNDLTDRLLPFAAYPTVQDALAQLLSAVERAEDDLATQTSIAARLISNVKANFIPGVGSSEDYGTAKARLFAHATDFHQADAIPGVYPRQATLLTFADDSQAFISDGISKGEELPVLLKKCCAFFPDDLLGDRIPRVFASRTEMLRTTKPIVLKYEAESRGAGTKRTYSSQWNQWNQFATTHDLKVLPADPSGIAEWLASRAKAQRRFSTINLGVQAVKAIHVHYDQPDPCDASVMKTLDGIRRALGVVQEQVAGLTLENIATIEATACTPRIARGGTMETAEHARMRGLQDIALLRVLFDGMLRISEALALLWASMSIEDDGSGLLHIANSKTDQACEGADVYVPRGTVAALEQLRGSACTDEKIFPFSERTARRRIKAAAAAAGLDGRFSGHSGRVGMAQTLAAKDFQLPAIQTAGRWKSFEMPARYTRLQRQSHSAVARLNKKMKEGTRLDC